MKSLEADCTTKKHKISARKIRKWILRILITCAILFLTLIGIGTVRYFMRKTKFNELYNQTLVIGGDCDIDLVFMLDSFGVPYSQSVDRSFVDEIKDSLEKEGRISSCLDLSNLYINKTWQLTGLLQNGVTIGEFKEIQNYSIDFTRHKYPERIKEDLLYPYDQTKKDTRIFDYIRDLEHPLICLSVSANDLMYFYSSSLEGLNLKKVLRILSNMDDALDRLNKHLRENIELLLSINPRAEIFLLGIYMPSDNYFLNGVGGGMLNKINRSISASCDGLEQVHFVDVDCLCFGILENDFHPSAQGQKVLASLIVESINYNMSDKWFVKEKVRASWDEFYSEPDGDDSDISKTTEKISNTILNSNLPVEDYVECTVAFENALYENNLQKITFKELEMLRDHMVGLLAVRGKREDWDKAISIEIIEKKILYGIEESENALDPIGVKNDKMSLLEYY